MNFRLTLALSIILLLVAIAFFFVPRKADTAKTSANGATALLTPKPSDITSIDFTDSAILVEFDKRDGPDRWPDVGFGGGSLEYTLGMCVNIQGHWNCSATVQFWYGRDLEASGLPSEIGRNWWYDQRWGALIGYQPSCGETVGIYAAAGNLRDIGNVIAKERTNIVLMPFCGAYRAGVGVLSSPLRTLSSASAARFLPSRAFSPKNSRVFSPLCGAYRSATAAPATAPIRNARRTVPAPAPPPSSLTIGRYPLSPGDTSSDPP